MFPFKHDLWRAIRAFPGELKALRERARTARVISALPEALRKDIGWPDDFKR
jgi:hypothetical protein